ncbi:MAG: OmpA family protein [Acidobacteriaceae bacterium]|nr:OmpA family protein [Acidobacteriaceae bacterium]
MKIILGAFVALSIGIAAAQTQSVQQGQPLKVKGVISSRNGPDMAVTEGDGTRIVAVLDDGTQVQMKEGHFGFRKKHIDLTLLLPGLRMEVEGTGNASGQLIAQKVTFTEADLQAAREIQAGTAPVESQEQQLSAEQQKLKQQEASLAQKEQQTDADARNAQQSANLANQRISELNSYTTKYKTDVYFGNDQISLSPEGKQSLASLASQALSTNAYMVQIAAYASRTGSAQLNEELSNERADAVIAYLRQSGHIPLYRILAPAAMGASSAAGSDPALNRRVVVKVVVNEGIAQ